MINLPTKFLPLSGVFHDKGDPEGIVVLPETGSAIQVSSLLLELEGRDVQLVLHHYAPGGTFDPSIRGLGSCLIGSFCRAGHTEDPQHLFSVTAQGVLKHLGEGTWSVGSTRIPLSSQMNGHYGRMILFAPGDVRGDASPDDLLRETTDLIQLLSSLRGTLKERP